MSISPGAEPARVHVRVLGAVTVTVDGEALRLGGGRPRSVLALLALEPGRAMSQDRLVAQLWPDDAATAARRTLQVHVGNLRKALQPAADALAVNQFILTRSDGYALVTGTGVGYDLATFEARAADARRLAGRGDLANAAELFEAAIAMCRGEPLEGLTSDPTIAAIAAQVAAGIEDVRDDAGEVFLRLGDAGAVLRLLDRAAHDLLRERRQALLATALYHLGRPAEALERLAQVRQHLMDELGLDPSPELRDLEQQILTHDVDVAGPRPSSPVEAGTVLRGSVVAPAGRLVGPFGKITLSAAATSLGRGGDQDIVVDDQQASRQHAVIRLTARGFVIRDALSTNGTLVNGERIDEHLLADGDMIVIGGTRLRFEVVRE